MTDQELKDIVDAVVAELEKSGVDFDYKIDTPLDTDTIFVIRGTAPNYQGLAVTWKGLLDIITSQATQAKNDAVTAKNAANEILEQVTNKESNVSTMKSEVYRMGEAVETLTGQAETAAETAVQKATEAGTSERNTKTYMESAQSAQRDATSAKEAAVSAQEYAETAKQGAEDARETAQGYMQSAQQSAAISDNNVKRFENVDFRQKSTGEVILDVDVTGTMEAFMDGMEQEVYEAIALTLEPDVPTAESHNFGVRGQICIDSNYLYVCVSDHTWKKIALLDL